MADVLGAASLADELGGVGHPRRTVHAATHRRELPSAENKKETKEFKLWNTKIVCLKRWIFNLSYHTNPGRIYVSQTMKNPSHRKKE